jgi:hypothetical protein
VIYEDGAIAAGALMQDARYTSGSALFGRTSALLRIPQFATYVNEPRTPPVVFLHELISPKGNQRLVAIQFSTIKNDQSGTIIFYPYEEAPAGVPRSKCMGLELIRMPRESLTLFAGQVDSTDASHFTIDYVLNNARETVDGWLFDDDTIRLMPRCGDVLYMPDRGIWTPGNGIGPNWIYRMGQTSLGHTNAAPTSRPSATVPDPIAALNARMQGTTKKPSTAQATPSAQ